MYLNEDHTRVRGVARRFARDVVRPIAKQFDRESRFPVEIYDRIAELGLFGITLPRSMGGPGFDTISYALVMAVAREPLRKGAET